MDRHFYLDNLDYKYKGINIDDNLPQKHYKSNEPELYGKKIQDDNLNNTPFKNLKKDNWELEISPNKINFDKVENKPFNLYHHNNNSVFNKNSLQGIQEDSILSRVYFSPKNINIIQNKIIDGIFILSDGQYKIGKQNEAELNIIMRSIYLQHSTNNNNCDIQKQVKILNKLVLEYCLFNVFTNIKQYVGYIDFIQNPKETMPKSKSTNIKGDKNTYNIFRN